MSEQLDKEGCFLTALTMAVVVLVMYAMIDLYVDRQSEHELRDLQRRVGQLEQGR